MYIIILETHSIIEYLENMSLSYISWKKSQNPGKLIFLKILPSLENIILNSTI